MKLAAMVGQLQSDATYPIKYNTSQPGITSAWSTEFVLLCGCGLPAGNVIDTDVPSKHRSGCREVKFHNFTPALLCLPFRHVLLIA